MIKNKTPHKISDSQGRKSYHQMDLELGEDLTLPNYEKRHKIGYTDPYESKLKKENK